MAEIANKSTKRSKTRKSYTPERRAEILAAAKSEGLTATAVQKRFGVTPVTYYSWRKNTGASKRSPASAGLGGDLGSQVRSEVQSKIRQLLPELVRGEVGQYLDSVFASSPAR